MAGLSSQVLHIWDVDEQICEIFGIWAVIRCWFMVTIVAIIQRWPQIWIQFSRIWWSNETGSTCQWFHVISCPNICVYIYRVVYRLYIYVYVQLYMFVWFHMDSLNVGYILQFRKLWRSMGIGVTQPFLISGVYHKTDCFICNYMYTHTVWLFVKQ